MVMMWNIITKLIENFVDHNKCIDYKFAPNNNRIRFYSKLIVQQEQENSLVIYMKRQVSEVSNFTPL